MSELKNTIFPRSVHWQLLASVSTAALLISFATPFEADGSEDNSNRPTVWIELGGQLSWKENEQDAFLSPFIPASEPPYAVVSPATVEKPVPTSWDGYAKISVVPASTDWIFSAAIAFGRSSQGRFLRQMTNQPDPRGVYVAYQNVTSRSGDNHTILDFSAGKDVGLGVGISSSLNLGVRYVQFSATRDALIQSQPTNIGFFHPYHRINAHLVADQKFRGVGPSLSWDASAALLGNHSDGEIALDWGINGAILFGRQSVYGHHQTTTAYYTYYYAKSSHQHTTPLNRSRRLVVPNIGGFAGFSWRYPNAKVSMGYRADFFFGAMDGGIDERHSKNAGFYGPFASVSIGLGG